MNDVDTLRAIDRAAGDVAALLGEHDSIAMLERLGLDGAVVRQVVDDVVTRTNGPVGTPQMLAAFAVGYLVGRGAP